MVKGLGWRLMGFSVVVVGISVVLPGGGLQASEERPHPSGEVRQKAQAIKEKYQAQRQQLMQECKGRMQQLEQQKEAELKTLRDTEHAKRAEEMKSRQQQRGP